MFSTKTVRVLGYEQLIGFDLYYVSVMGIYFDQLTNDQILEVWNGIGSARFSYKPPIFCFERPTKRHDFDYYCGSGREWHRWEDDFRFLRGCLRECWYQRKFYAAPFAFIYYFFLVILGWASFEYGPPAENWDEVEKRVEKDKVWLSTHKPYGLGSLKSGMSGLFDSLFHRRTFKK